MILDPTSAEETVIGAILLRPDAIHGIDLTVDEFQSAECRRAYEAMTNLVFVHHAPLDLITLESELARLGHAVPTMATLTDFAARVATAEDLPHWARMVRLAAAKRRVLLALEEQRNRVEVADLDELVGAIETMQRTVVKACGHRARFATVGSLLDQVIERLRADPSGASARRKTRLKALDIICGGLPYGHPTMVGGRTSNGKTVLMRTIADNVASDGEPVGFISLEDAPVDLVQWQALRRARIGIERIVQGVITADEIDCIAKLRGKMSRLPLVYCHDTALDGAQVCQRLRQMVAQHGIKVGVVDFLQRVRVPGVRPYTEELRDVIDMLCNLAVDTGMALVVGSQLNRENEREKRPPQLIDFQGCGGIEQLAELAILVHRQWRQKRDESKPRTAKLLEALVAKMKLGEPRTARLFFEGSFGYVCDPEPGFFTPEFDGPLAMCSFGANTQSRCDRFAIDGEIYCGLHLHREPDYQTTDLRPESHWTNTDEEAA